MSRKIKDLEFVVDDETGHQRTFDKFEDAVNFAVHQSIQVGDSVNLDVLIYSRAAASKWGGDVAVEQYDEDPDASVSQRIRIRAEDLGRVA